MLRRPALALALLLSGVSAFAAEPAFVRATDALILGPAAAPAMVYRLKPPADSGLPVEAGGYFHPLTTPAGITVTDFVPSDHRHHRGLFFAWVNLQGPVPSDFWGWGKLAPIADRRIVNRTVIPAGTGFVAENDWLAGPAGVLRETLRAATVVRDGVRVLDLAYELVPAADLTLPQGAFSGFCLRVRQDGTVRFLDPAGEVSRPNPSPQKPDTNWPAAPWYACEQTLPAGTVFGAAVLDHPANPPSTWHNQRGTRMINPCVHAPAALALPAGRPLVLRYRVLTFDGPLPRAAVARLAAEFAAAP